MSMILTCQHINILILTLSANIPVSGTIFQYMAHPAETAKFGSQAKRIPTLTACISVTVEDMGIIFSLHERGESGPI